MKPLSTSEIDEQLREIERYKLELSLYDFFRAAWPQFDAARLRTNWHLQAIAEHLEAVTNGEIRYLLMMVPPRSAKALDCDTPILTTWGWRKHGELRSGDFVFGQDGQPRRVISVTEHFEAPSSDVVFDDDATITAADTHLWRVMRDNNYTGDKWARCRKPILVETRGLAVFQPGNYRTEVRPDAIELASPPNLAEKRLLIDPYILGCWLGDGNTASAYLTVGEEDIDHFRPLGVVVRTGDKPYSTGNPVYRIRLERLQTKLRILGILGDKHIPDDYIEASIEQRWELLRGLMDTDGSADIRGKCTYSTKLPKLADGILKLLWSLGIKPNHRWKFNTLNGKVCGPYCYIGFTPPAGAKIFALARKQERVKDPQNARSRHRYVREVNPVGTRMVNCIQVEGEIYLAGYELVPTHNSSMTNICWPAWTWARRWREPLSGPGVRFLCLSYSGTLAHDIATTARRLVMSEWYQHYWSARVQLNPDQMAIEHFTNTAGGARIASWMGATLGRGGGVKLIDDPLSREQAESDIERNKVIQAYDEGLATRDSDPVTSAEVIIMQRLHRQDLAGHIIDKFPGRFTYVTIPMRFDTTRVWYSQLRDPVIAGDPRTEDRELFWPEQFPEHIVREREERMGRIATAGQYQQSPTARGGNIIQQEWWKCWPDDAVGLADLRVAYVCPRCRWSDYIDSDQQTIGCPACGNAARQVWPFPEMSFRVLVVDTAYGENEGNSFSAATCWGVWHGKDGAGRAILTDAWHGRVRLRGDVRSREPSLRRGLVETIYDMATRRHADLVLIERKSRGVDLYQELERIVKEWPFSLAYSEPAAGYASGGGVSKRAKAIRLEAVQPLFVNGLVWAPDLDWAQMVTEEVISFPNAENDDLMDTCSAGLKYLRDHGHLQSDAEYLREQTRRTAWRGRGWDAAAEYGVG